MRRPTGLVIALSAALLTGCTPAPTMPQPMSADEIQTVLDARNADWWRSISPTEPMPDIEPIRTIAESDSAAIITECAQAALPPGAAADLRDSETTSTTGTALDRAYFRCTLQYPVEIPDPARWGLYSPEQLTWLYDYYETRLIPCLRLAGYLVGTIPQREDFVDSIFGHWSPYYAMSPQPDTASEWVRIDLRCPPPPFGDEDRPGVVVR